MGFFGRLARLGKSQEVSLKANPGPTPPLPPDPLSTATEFSDFDREQWRRKLKRLLAHYQEQLRTGPIFAKKPVP